MGFNRRFKENNAKTEMTFPVTLGSSSDEERRRSQWHYLTKKCHPYRIRRHYKSSPQVSSKQPQKKYGLRALTMARVTGARWCVTVEEVGAVCKKKEKGKSERLLCTTSVRLATTVWVSRNQQWWRDPLPCLQNVQSLPLAHHQLPGLEKAQPDSDTPSN